MSNEELCELVREWYIDAGYITGGAFHVVLDDGNYATELVQWCWDTRREYGCEPDDDELMARIRDGLLCLTEDEFEELYHGNWGMAL